MVQQPQRFIESCYHPEDLQTATQGRRLAGYVLDLIIVVVTFGVGWLVWLLLAAPKGQSPGKQLLGMYIIRSDGSRAGGAYTWVRELIIKVLLFDGFFWVLGAMTGGLGQLLWVIPALWCVWDAERQCLWDKVGSTYIAHSPQGFRPLTANEIRIAYAASAGAMVEHLSRVGRWIPVIGIDLYLGNGARLHGFAAGPRYEMVERGVPQYSLVTRRITFTAPYTVDGNIAVALLAEELAHAIEHWMHGPAKYHHGPAWRQIFRRLLEYYDAAPIGEIEAAFAPGREEQDMASGDAMTIPAPEVRSSVMAASAGVREVTDGVLKAIAEAAAAQQAVLDSARSDLADEVRIRRTLTEASRRAREWPQELEAAVAEAKKQDARIAARHDELRAVTDRHLEAMRGASEAHQASALAEAASIRASAQGLFEATLAQVRQQESEAMETVDFPLGASIVGLGARTTEYLASGLMGPAGEYEGPRDFSEAWIDGLTGAMVTTAEPESAASAGLTAALADTVSGEDGSVARRNAVIEQVRRLEPLATARLEEAVAAVDVNSAAAADRMLTDALATVDSDARRIRSALVDVARQHERAAAVRQEALAQAEQPIEQADGERREALRQAGARMQSALEQAESRLAAAADEDATAASHASAARTAHANLRRSAGEATLKATADERTVARAAASQAREALLGAIANHREAALQAAASRRLALFAAAGSDQTSWDFVSQRLADRRPFSVRVSRVSENELHASIDGVAGVLDASDVVWWDRGPATTPAVVLNKMLDNEIRVVATGVLPSGVVRLSEREAVESWTEWSSLWRLFRQREPFFVDIIENRAHGARISCAGWSVDVPYIAPAHEWIHPNDGVDSPEQGEPSQRKMVQITAFDRAENRLAVSEQAAMVTRLGSGRAVGESFVVRINGIARNGTRLFIRVSGLEGVVRKDELAWRRWRDIDLEALAFEVGQEIPVVVLPQRRAERGEELEFSHRRASWPMVRTKLRVGHVVPGVAFEVGGEHVLLQLPGDVLARAAGNAVVAHIQGRRETQYPEYVVSPGDIVPVKILNVNHRQVRVDVSYREGRTAASEGGSWKFDSRGRVLQIPEDVRAIFPVESANMEPRLRERREYALQAEGLGKDEVEW